MIQATIPSRGRVLLNAHGTAAGFHIEHNGTGFFAMPGVPSEMKAMFETSVLPEIRQLAPGVSRVRCIQCFGTGESVIGELLEDLMQRCADPEVATQVSNGIVTVRVTARAATEADAEAQLDEAAREICGRLGDAVYDTAGRDLEVVVAELLERTNVTCAFAESCTGGAVAAMLTRVPGISRFFLEGAVTYSNDAKIRRLQVPSQIIEAHGAVSEAVARAMARGMRATSGAELALAVTGIAGPEGGTPEKPVGRIFLALADEAGLQCERLQFAGDRNRIRHRAAKAALNMVRLRLERRARGHGPTG
jgi:nicotinamide-nucleotide amidase